MLESPFGASLREFSYDHAAQIMHCELGLSVVNTTCPVCQTQLDFAPWHNNAPSDEICPSCGIQFGYNDMRSDLRQRVYSLWRAAWIANGRRAFQGEAWREVSIRISQRAREETNAV